MRKCDHVDRVAIHPSIKFGGVSIGRCENECLPGMVVCWQHANREALAMMIRTQDREIRRIRDGIAELVEETSKDPPTGFGLGPVMHAVDLEELRALINRR